MPDHILQPELADCTFLVIEVIRDLVAAWFSTIFITIYEYGYLWFTLYTKKPPLRDACE